MGVFHSSQFTVMTRSNQAARRRTTKFTRPLKAERRRSGAVSGRVQ